MKRIIFSSIAALLIAAVPIQTFALSNSMEEAKINQQQTKINQVYSSEASTKNSKNMKQEADRFINETDISHTAIPQKNDKHIEIKNKDSGDHIRIDLPGSQGSKDAALVHDKALLYEDTEVDADTAVTSPTEGMVETFHILRSPNAPKEFAYNLELKPQWELQQADSKTIYIIDENQKKIGKVAAPWAKDARGAEVPLSLSIRGNTVTLHVEHGTQYSYPIVADPSISFGWMIYVRFSQEETKSISQSRANEGMVALAGVLCAKIPHVVPVASCLAGVAMAGDAIGDTFDNAAAENKCVEVRFDYDSSLGGWKRYDC